jgi:hypothetical protein
VHVVNDPRPRRAKQPAGRVGDTEVLIRVAMTAIGRDRRVVHRVTASRPAAAFESAIEAGA